MRHCSLRPKADPQNGKTRGQTFRMIPEIVYTISIVSATNSLESGGHNDPIWTIFPQEFSDDSGRYRRLDSAAESTDGKSAARPSCGYGAERWQACQPRERLLESASLPYEASALRRWPLQDRDGGRSTISAFSTSGPTAAYIPKQCRHYLFGETAGRVGAPDCELRGHYAGGHYLSACALM